MAVHTERILEVMGRSILKVIFQNALSADENGAGRKAEGVWHVYLNNGCGYGTTRPSNGWAALSKK